MIVVTDDEVLRIKYGCFLWEVISALNVLVDPAAAYVRRRRCRGRCGNSAVGFLFILLRRGLLLLILRLRRWRRGAGGLILLLFGRRGGGCRLRRLLIIAAGGGDQGCEGEEDGEVAQGAALRSCGAAPVRWEVRALAARPPRR